MILIPPILDMTEFLAHPNPFWTCAIYIASWLWFLPNWTLIKGYWVVIVIQWWLLYSSYMSCLCVHYDTVMVSARYLIVYFVFNVCILWYRCAYSMIVVYVLVKRNQQHFHQIKNSNPNHYQKHYPPTQKSNG